MPTLKRHWIAVSSFSGFHQKWSGAWPFVLRWTKVEDVGPALKQWIFFGWGEVMRLVLVRVGRHHFIESPRFRHCFFSIKTGPLQTRDGDPGIFQCWASVADGSATLKQHAASRSHWASVYGQSDSVIPYWNYCPDIAVWLVLIF